MNADCIDVNNEVDEALYKCKCRDGFIDKSEKKDGTSCKGSESSLMEITFRICCVEVLFFDGLALVITGCVLIISPSPAAKDPV